MSNFIRVLCIVVGLNIATISHAQYFGGNKENLAYACTNPIPQDSAIWAAFDIYVKGTYSNKRPVIGFDRSYAYGHALGRLALAHDNNSEKLQGVSCVKKALEQHFGSAQAYSGTLAPGRTARETSLGLHDNIVANKFGIYERRPLYEVFDAALRIAGRTKYDNSGNYYKTKRSNPYTANHAAGTGITGIGPKPSPDILSSTTPRRAGTNTSCTQGDRWSLSQARTLMNRAFGRASRMTGNCTGDGWSECKIISDLLHDARDHIFQTVDQNHDGIANCRLCNYDEAITIAKELVSAENWFEQKYYYSAGGLSTIYYTIQDMNRDPICKIPSPVVRATPVYPPAPVYDNPPAPVRRADKFPPINSSYWVLAETKMGGKASFEKVPVCQHQPGKLTWKKPGKGGAKITYNSPPSRLSPGEKFTITASGNVNITADYARLPTFKLNVSGKHIGNASSAVIMNRSNTETGLRYSLTGQKTYSAPSAYNGIDEFTIVMSTDWCPKAFYVYKKGR